MDIHIQLSNLNYKEIISEYLKSFLKFKINNFLN